MELDRPTATASTVAAQNKFIYWKWKKQTETKTPWTWSACSREMVLDDNDNVLKDGDQMSCYYTCYNRLDTG